MEEVFSVDRGHDLAGALLGKAELLVTCLKCFGFAESVPRIWTPFRLWSDRQEEDIQRSSP